MKPLLISIATVTVAVSVAAFASASPTDPAGVKAQQAHTAGNCSSLGPGTGLRDGKGWVVSMLPGKHEFRVKGGGTAYLTVARLKSMEFDSGRPYYIVIEGAQPSSILEWKVPGSSGWARIPQYFLYPPQ